MKNGERFNLTLKKKIPALDERCGRYLTFRDLIQCGETQESTQIDNLPVESESYVALDDLAKFVIDPVIDNFGEIKLTYGFCSHELSKYIPGRIAPPLDQHAACEINRSGKLICKRKGAAVDFAIEGKSMLEVAKWVVSHCHFDRLYFYGDTLPIHVSVGPDKARRIAWMKDKKGGGLRPQMLSVDKFLILIAGEANSI